MHNTIRKQGDTWPSRLFNPLTQRYGLAELLDSGDDNKENRDGDNNKENSVVAAMVKGLLQILWERGFIDPNVGARRYYNLCGRNDRYGNTMLDTSLSDLMRNCIRFIEEETLLQTQACKMEDNMNRITVD